MRIAMFAHNLDHGGITRVAFAVGEQLAAMGIETAIVGATREKTAPDVATGVSIDVVELGVTGGHLAAVLPLARWLRSWRPDVVFSNATPANISAILARLASRAPAAIVAVEHNHYSSYIPPAGDGRRMRRLRDVEMQVLYPLADAVAGVSRGVVEDLEYRFPRVKSKLVVLPSPGRSASDVQRLAAVRPEHPWFDAQPRPRIVTCVANIVPRKSQETLIAALPAIRARGGDVRLLLVGRVDNHRYARQLERDARRLGVAEYVSFAGYQRNPLAFMAPSDVVALSSRNEGYGLVLVEAMACGVPVVATDCPSGPSDALAGGDAGLLVPVADHDAMAAAILRLLLDPALRERLIARGIVRAKAHEPALVAQAYLDLARQTLAARRG
jgi:glycosyltransferase involved in cell wall biosynthesis